jgi:hypothetical protein
MWRASTVAARPVPGAFYGVPPLPPGGRECDGAPDIAALTGAGPQPNGPVVRCPRLRQRQLRGLWMSRSTRPQPRLRPEYIFAADVDADEIWIWSWTAKTPR